MSANLGWDVLMGLGSAGLGKAFGGKWADVLPMALSGLTQTFQSAQANQANQANLANILALQKGQLGATQPGGSWDQNYAAQTQGLNRDFLTAANDYRNLMGNTLQAQQAREQNLMGGFSQALGGIQRGFDQRTAGIMGQYNADAARLGQQYQQRYDTGMGMLKGMGDQAAADIRSDYAKQQAAVQQQMAQRGLGNTSLASSALTGVQREQQNSLTRLTEALRSQALNTHAGLSGDTRGYLGGVQSGRANLAGGLTGDSLNFATQAAQARTQLGQQLSAETMNALSGYNEGLMNLGQSYRDQLAGLRAGDYPQRLAYDTGVIGQLAGTLAGVTNAGPPPVNWGDMLMATGNTAMARQMSQTKRGGLFGLGGSLGGLGMGSGIGAGALIGAGAGNPLLGAAIGGGVGYGFGSSF